jgi:hypothetical protein
MCHRSLFKAHQAFTVMIDVTIRFVNSDALQFTISVVLISEIMNGLSRDVGVMALTVITSTVVTVWA